MANRSSIPCHLRIYTVLPASPQLVILPSWSAGAPLSQEQGDAIILIQTACIAYLNRSHGSRTRHGRSSSSNRGGYQRRARCSFGKLGARKEHERDVVQGRLCCRKWKQHLKQKLLALGSSCGESGMIHGHKVAMTQWSEGECRKAAAAPFAQPAWIMPLRSIDVLPIAAQVDCKCASLPQTRVTCRTHSLIGAEIPIHSKCQCTCCQVIDSRG
jgi:hypothetical protein